MSEANYSLQQDCCTRDIKELNWCQNLKKMYGRHYDLVDT